MTKYLYKMKDHTSETLIFPYTVDSADNIVI